MDVRPLIVSSLPSRANESTSVARSAPARAAATAKTPTQVNAKGQRHVTNIVRYRINPTSTDVTAPAEPANIRHASDATTQMKRNPRDEGTRDPKKRNAIVALEASAL